MDENYNREEVQSKVKECKSLAEKMKAKGYSEQE